MMLQSPLAFTRKYLHGKSIHKLRFTTRFQATSAATAANLNWEQAKPFNEIPGPKPMPIPWGNVWKFSRIGPYANMDFVETHRNIAKKYGPIVRITGLGREDTVYLYDADYIEMMFRNDGVWPIVDIHESFTRYTENRSHDSFKHGSMTSRQGEEWRNNRSSVNQITVPKQAIMYAEPVDQVANMFIDRMKYLRDSNSELPKDFYDELSKCSIECVANFAFGTRLGCLEKNWEFESEAGKLITTSRTFMYYLHRMNLGFSPPIWKYVSTPTWRKFVRTSDEVFNMCRKYSYSRLAEVKEKMKDKNYQPGNLFEQLLQEEKSSNLAVLMPAGLLLGGTEPVATTVASAIYHISKNPVKQERLYQELKKILPHKESPITSKTLNELKYLKACIKESMRISPSSFGSQRRAAKDYVIDQYRIPKGTSVIAANTIASNDEKYFKNSDKFIPERWLRSEKDLTPANKEVHPFASLPFGFGPRMCIGRRFAELELEIIIAKIMRNFKVEYNYGGMTWKYDGVYRCAQPLQFKIQDRIN